MNISYIVNRLIKPYTKYLWLEKKLYTKNQENIDKLLKEKDFIYDYMTKEKIYFRRIGV